MAAARDHYDPAHSHIPNSVHQQASEDDAEAESRHFQTVLLAFQQFAQRQMSRVGKQEHDFSRIDPALQRLVPGTATKMRALKEVCYF